MTVPHVMDAEKPHFIEYMWLKDANSDKGVSRPLLNRFARTLLSVHFLAVLAVQAFKATDPSPPTLQANIKRGSKVVPLLFCNLHGLWEGEAITV